MLCEEDSVELPLGAILWQSCVNTVMIFRFHRRGELLDLLSNLFQPCTMDLTNMYCNQHDSTKRDASGTLIYRTQPDYAKWIYNGSLGRMTSQTEGDIIVITGIEFGCVQNHIKTQGRKFRELNRLYNNDHHMGYFRRKDWILCLQQRQKP
jgi:hypothetical protein